MGQLWVAGRVRLISMCLSSSVGQQICQKVFLSWQRQTCKRNSRNTQNFLRSHPARTLALPFIYHWSNPKSNSKSKHRDVSSRRRGKRHRYMEGWRIRASDSVHSNDRPHHLAQSSWHTATTMTSETKWPWWSFQVQDSRIPLHFLHFKPSSFSTM